MTPTQYIRLRKQLGLSNYALAPILGVSLRQAQRYESGQTVIPEPIAKLLKLYSLHGYRFDGLKISHQGGKPGGEGDGITLTSVTHPTSAPTSDTNKPDECPREPSSTDPAQ